jgi:hypothetical protein
MTGASAAVGAIGVERTSRPQVHSLQELHDIGSTLERRQEGATPAVESGKA